MRIRDISLTLHTTMLHWPDTAVPEVDWEYRLDRGDGFDVSAWRIGAHSGTHVDAASHFIRGGATAELLELDLLVGPCRVVALDDRVPAVDRGVVEALDLAGVRRLLFRTSNSARRLDSTEFDEGYVAFTADGAQALAEHGIVSIGIDYLSVEMYGRAEPEAHLAMLSRRIAVIEGLDLRGVEPGDYILCCLPLRLAGAEAAPARAVLLDDYPT